MSHLAELLAASGVAGRDDRTTRLPDGAKLIYLHAGHLYASAEPAQITTVLGSCVAICLYDAMSAVGGMNHYMLPNDVGANCQTPRYANFAITQLIERVLALGAEHRRLQAKLFGGACVLASFQGSGNDLGSKNIEVARRRLEEEKIPVVAEDLGGNQGRRLVFRTDTGLALTKRV